MKEQCIEELESFYCNRLTELIDCEEFDNAHAIYQEFVIDQVEPEHYFFFEIL